MPHNIIDFIGWNIPPQKEETMFVDGRGNITGTELFCMAYALAERLVSEGCFNQPVIVLAEHRKETIAAFLGILLSGNYYVPVSEDTAPDRMERIKTELGALWLVGMEEQAKKYQRTELWILSEIASGQKIIKKERLEALRSMRSELPPRAPMYIIYTSGSTGEPKGIVKSHASMISFLKSYQEEFCFCSADRFGNQTPFQFDASAKDIYTVLYIKARMYILEKAWFVKPLRLAEYLQRERITVIQWVPAALSIFSRLRVFDQVVLKDLRKVFFVGEVFAPKQLAVWRKGLPDAEFVNLYGSSEMAGICLFYRIPKGQEIVEAIPIGYPLSNAQVYLIADGKRITEMGRTGEIYVKSEALAEGYLRNTNEKHAVFLTNPDCELPRGRYYRSGDLARFGKMGELQYVSRNDFQIKHMGHRIELGEIECTVLQHKDIQSACCIYDRERLILFYTGMEDKKALREYLKEKLDPYMQPSQVIQLDEMPLNANGKTDREQLKEGLQRGSRKRWKKY